MEDIDASDTDEKPNGRLPKLKNVISNNNNKKHHIRIINNNELECGVEKNAINDTVKREENGKVQSAVCDIVNNSKKDIICQSNDDNKTGINEEYLAVGKILGTENVKSPELSNSSKGIGRKKHHHTKNQKPSLHVQFHQDEASGVDGASIGTSSSSSTRTSESSSDEESSSERFSETRAPDGGWGWVVVFASFIVNLIADGITFSFGVIYVEFLHYFGEARGKTACIGSLFMAMPLLSGPIASFLTDRFGCRKVSIFGAILAAVGFIISSFTDSIEVLFLTFGIIAGFGLSLCYVAAVVIVAYYFDKKRSFATGLSVCGSGIGTFVFAPLTQYLLEEYGWRGTTLILAGFFLNMCVCGALMRDLPWTANRFKAKLIENRQKRTRKKSQNRSGSSIKSLRTATSSADSFSQGQPSADELRKILTSGQIPEYMLPKNKEVEGLKVPGKNDLKSTSLVNIPTFVRSGERVPLEVLELLSKQKNVYRCLVQNYPSLLISSRSCSDSGLLAEQATITSVKSAPSHHQVPRQLPLSPLAVHSNSPDPNSRPNDQWVVKRSDSTQRRLPTAYLKDLRVHRHSLTYRGAMLNINRYRLRASSCPDIYRNSMTTIAKEKGDWYGGLFEFWDIMVMIDVSHFLDVRFLLFAVSNFLLYTWYDVPYVYLADNAIEMGFSETDASYLISAIGILNMIGEIVLGWAGDRFNANLVYAGCMFLCGAVTALVPLLTSNIVALYVVSGAFGLFIAANYSLTSIILVELITIERFTNAYGLLLLVQGIANLVGPPLAGWIYDVTNSYDLSFYLAGAFISISGIMLLVLPAIDKLRTYKREKLRLTLASWDNSPSKKNNNANTV